MIYPPPPGLTLLAYQFGSISKTECEWRLKKWNEKHAQEEDQVVDRDNVIEVLEKAKTVIENWVPMFEQYNTPAGIDYAIALLKEQDQPTRPVFNGRYWECEKCGEMYQDILEVRKYRHCPWCGRRLIWIHEETEE